MREEQLAEVFNSRRGQPDRRRLRLVEPDRLAATDLFSAELHPLPGTWNAIQHRPDVRRLALQLGQRLRQQRHRQVVLLRMRTLGQRGQLIIEVETDLMHHPDEGTARPDALLHCYSPFRGGDDGRRAPVSSAVSACY